MSTALIWQTVSTSSSDTERLGQLLGKHLAGGEVLELSADLGGGKTTFVRGLVVGAKSSDKVASPTFTLNRIYKTPKFNIYHYDFYRLSEPGVLADQLAESLDEPWAVTVVEWAGQVEDVLPKDSLKIEFKPTPTSEDERQITFYYPLKFEPMIKKIQNGWQRTES